MDQRARDEQGMNELRGTMNAGAFTCLLSLLNWAKLWQNLHEGTAEMDADSAHAMMMPFSGVGADPAAWMEHGPKVVGSIVNEISKWSADEAYRAANTMPWCMLSVVGPGLALSAKGMQFSIEAHRIIGEYFTVGESPDVPSLADVIARAEEESSATRDGTVSSGQQASTEPTARRTTQRSRAGGNPFASNTKQRLGDSSRRSV